MKRLITLLSLAIFLTYGFQADAQSITNYTFTASSGTFTALTGGTTMALSSGSFDEGWFNAIPIGFTFVYMGVPYNTVSTSTNGWMTFGQNITSAALTNALATGGNRPVIAPLWDDNDIQINTNFSYQTSGSPGSQIFTAEWLNVQWNYSATGNTVSHQVKLYEATGVVEFVYRDEGGTVNSGSASIGITAIGTGSGNYLSLNGTGASPTASSTTETTSLSTKPASGQTYTFTPPATTPTAPSGLNFTAITGTGMTLNWIDNSSDETGFAIFRSLDNVNYTYVTNVAASTVTYVASGLSFGTTYHWKVYAVNEGMASSPAYNFQATIAASLSGNKNIPTDYASLTAAFAAITTNGLVGNLNLILESTYTGAGETYPILGPSALSVGSYIVTVYPDVSGLTITSSNTTGTIDLNGSKNVIFDGRVDATGSTKDLIIENTTTTGWAVRFINDALNNTLKYCVIKGVNTSTTNGVVLFSTTTGTTGNDNNIIDNCDIRDGATTPTNCIYSLGTTTNSTLFNSNNTVSNCNIFNFFISTSVANGVNLGSGNTDWTITGNSLYQAASRAFTTSSSGFIGITVAYTSGNNFTVNNNFIGGSTSSCGGSAWTQTGAFTHTFIGIRISVGTTTASNVHGNTIKNISITTSNTSSINAAIAAVTGSINVGSTSGNTIGDQSSTGNITYVGAGTGSQLSGILAGTGTPGIIVISNNLIGGIAISGAGTTIFRGINTQGSATSYTISSNTIGSPTTANSITNSSNNTVAGILSSSSSSNVSVLNNTIANLSTTGTSTANLLYGIFATSGVNTVIGNTVRNLSSTSAALGTGSSASVIGISQTASTTGGQTSSMNSVYSLSNTTVSAAVSIIGIHYGGPTSGTNLVSRNFVHSLSLGTSSTTAIMTGLNVNGGLTTYQNNMIAIGGGQTTGFVINGINEGVGTNNFYFNSVYIGGSGVGGSASTYAFNSPVTTNTRIFKNNIFFNARSNGAGTGKHYAVRYGGSAPNPTGLTADFNLFYANGTGNVLGYFNLLDVTTLAAWRTATGQDNNSLNADPVYNAPATSTPDLHIHATNPTPVEATGTLIASVTDDYDGDTRASFTPTDIGADAGNFTLFGIVNPSGVSATASSNTQIDIAFTPNPSSNDVVIVWNSTGAFTDPTGTPPSPGSSFAGGILLYQGTSSPQSHGSLTPGTIYYYKAFSYDGISSYSTGIPVNATTLVPANPGSFTATASSSTQIDLGWTLNGSSDNIMVAWNSINTFGNPIQGTSYSPTNTITGGGTVLYVGSLLLYNHTPLSVLTPYFYKIWSVDGANGYSTGLTANATTWASLPYFQDFNGGTTLPTGWTGDMLVIANHGTSSTNGLTRNLWSNVITTNGVCPRIAAITANTQLEFDYRIVDYTSYPSTATVLGASDKIEIQVSTDGTSYTTIYTIDQTTHVTSLNFANKIISLSAYSGSSIFIKILGTWGSGDYYIDFDNFKVQQPTNMVYTSSTTTQNNTSSVTSNSTNQEIIGIQVVTTNNGNPLNITKFIVNANGTTSTSDILNAKIFSTGTSPTFATTTQFGSTVGSPTTSNFNITGTQALSEGTNYFWLTYDIALGATVDNYVDGECSTVTVGGTDYTPTIAAPAGNRQIKNLIIIGTGTSTQRQPFGMYFGYERSAALYTGAEIGLTASINAIDWYIQSLTSAANGPVKIYLKTTTASTLTSDTWANMISGATLVYDATPTFVAGGWQTFNITSFSYTSTSNNLLVLVETNYGGGGGEGSTAKAIRYSTATSQHQTWFADTSPPSGTGTVGSTRPNVRLLYAPITPMAYSSSTTTQANTSQVAQGATGAQIIGVEIVTTGSTSPISVSGFNMNTNGTTTASDITAARLYSTGTSNTFATTTQFGLQVPNPSGIFSFTGLPVALSTGTNYFWLVYDIATGASDGNVVDAECTRVTVAATNYIPTITAPTGSRTIKAPLSGTKTVGSGGDYTTLTGAGGLFETLNSLGMSGSVTANITSNLTEPGTFALNQWTESGIGGYTLTIKPAASTTPTVSGSLNSNALIRFNGASRVTIDGSNNGTTSRDLTLANTSVTGPYTILIGSTGTNTIADMTVKNCTITNGSNSSSAVVVSDATILGDPGYFDNLVIDNNLIQKAWIGLFIVAETGEGTNFLITNNNLDVAGANSIRTAGMYLEGVDNGTISGNNIGNFDSADDISDVGIAIGPGSTSIDIFKNRIDNINYSGINGYGAHGIEVATEMMNAGIYIFNNLISNLTGDGWSYTSSLYGNDNPIGILLTSAQSGIYINYNSIYLNGNTLDQSSAMSMGICLRTGSVAEITNNIIVNNLGLLDATGYGSCGIYAEAANTQFTAINNNDYYVNPTGSGAKDIGRISTSPATSLAAWQAATLQDVNSINADPLYTDAILHLSAPYSPAIGKAAVISIITDDYTGILRHPSYPTIGAHEYAPVLTWTGTTSTAWETPTNWSLGFLPDGTYWVIIPNPLPSGNYPVIGISVTGNVYGLTIEPGATVDLFGTLNVVNP